MGRLHIHRLLIALATVMALVAPIRPAIAAAAPLDTAICGGRAGRRPDRHRRSTTSTRSEPAPASSSDPGGEVLTNFHVVQGADEITAHNVGTGRDFPADLVGYDRTHDIAVLQLRGAGGPAGRAARRLRSGRGRGADRRASAMPAEPAPADPRSRHQSPRSTGRSTPRTR